MDARDDDDHAVLDTARKIQKRVNCSTGEKESQSPLQSKRRDEKRDHNHIRQATDAETDGQ
jgi:hypothetical protein